MNSEPSDEGRSERALAALIQECHDKGYSFRTMSDRATRAGHPISHAQLADYAKGRVAKVPDREQIEAIAVATDNGVETVRRAAMRQYWGYEPRELRLARGRASRAAAAVPPNLSPEAEEELARMIQAWVAARRES